jgi:hypothetical protein
MILNFLELSNIFFNQVVMLGEIIVK